MTEETKGPGSVPPLKDAGGVPPLKDKVEKLADDAVAAGSRITDNPTGAKVADFADDVFEKAEELGKKALDSETGRKVAAKASELGKKAMDTDMGHKVAAAADDLGSSDAGQTAKKIWNTPVGRNVGAGAAAGAAAGLIVPFFGPLFGAVVGGGLGYLRTLAKAKKP